jgi:hypothetical protein
MYKELQKLKSNNNDNNPIKVGNGSKYMFFKGRHTNDQVHEKCSASLIREIQTKSTVK